MGRQDTTIWTCTLDGVPLGRFQTGGGGRPAATSHKAWRGAGIGEVERGGRVTSSNITLSRENNGNPTEAWLRSKINKRGTIQKTPADDDGNPRMAEQIAYNGTLLEAGPAGDNDTMNDGDIEMIELVFGVDT